MHEQARTERENDGHRNLRHHQRLTDARRVRHARVVGGWIILLIGMPTGALVVLLVLKTAVDLRAHRNEHAHAARRQG
jgi:hypothetical protein